MRAIRTARARTPRPRPPRSVVLLLAVLALVCIGSWAGRGVRSGIALAALAGALTFGVHAVRGRSWLGTRPSRPLALGGLFVCLVLAAALAPRAGAAREPDEARAPAASASEWEASPGPGSKRATPSSAVPSPSRRPASSARGSASPRSARTSGAGSALQALAALPVKGRAPMSGYSRDQFGPEWADVDGNGCDTRDDVLARQMREVRRAGDGCEVTGGVLVSPYSGETLRRPRARGAEGIDIDHVVALGDAWQTGGQRIAFSARERLANDPLNLIAVDASSNRQKGDADAASWLPPRRAERCAYVARQVAVKRAYRLWVTAAERDAVRAVLSGCPGERLPSGAALPLRAAPAPTHSSSRAGTDTTYFQNCSAARGAGVAPIRRGQPGYRAGLDRDDDGVACEGS